VQDERALSSEVTEGRSMAQFIPYTAAVSARPTSCGSPKKSSIISAYLPQVQAMQFTSAKQRPGTCVGMQGVVRTPLFSEIDAQQTLRKDGAQNLSGLDPSAPAE
jgi:hypothetical protein